MDTFGERLRQEREGRGLTIQAVSEIVGVDHDRLLALERNEFERQPDEAAMVECLRAYAGCLQVEADLMIEDYLQERARCLERLSDALDERVEIPPAVTRAADDARPRVSPVLGSALILAAVVILAAWWMSARGTATPAETAPATQASEVEPQASTPDGADAAASKPAPAPRRATESSAPATASPAGLSVPDHGVGTGVAKRELIGAGNRFGEGAEVWFWTRVEGGSRGDKIYHVWIHSGVEVARVSLSIGGARWRTYSAKVLGPGTTGDWAVEARAESGRVLARREFVCVD